MTTERWLQIEALFTETLNRSRDERAKFLKDACGDDAELREEVDRLLAGHNTGSKLLDTPPSVLAVPDRSDIDDLDSSADDLLDTLVGAYRIERLIGRGGMGQVYSANRADGVFSQEVAVKVLRRGLDTDDVLQRFRSERQILAGLRHPNVARLLDGGATDDGRPYLVLEYVEGEPLTTYADAEVLSLDERLRLFLTVCGAVQAAHQAFVVHRDLKPSNILVARDESGGPHVKLLDFGIAKLLDSRTGESVPHTRTNVRLMTPAYASPEQVRGDPITTASDVYALGVVLYELLTGHRPYQIDSISAIEVERIVCEQQPSRPSSRVAQAADSVEIGAKRGISIERLQRRLRGDLDTILLKALQKDPSRRYGSASGLADDLRKHMAGLPVVARPDTARYRLATFVRRHRAGVGAAALVFLLVSAAAVVAGVQASRIQAQADVVQHERDRAEHVLSFLLDLFASADPTGQRGTDLTARELLQAGALKVERDLRDQPAVQAALMDAMGQVYLSLGAFDEAERLATRAHQLRLTLYGSDHPEIAQSLHLLGAVAAEQSRLATADSILSRSLNMRRRILPHTHPDFTQNLVDLAWIRMLRDEYNSADALNGEALTGRRQGSDSAAVAEVFNSLGILRRRQGDLDEAGRMHREALSIRRRWYGPSHYYIGQSLNNLAIVLEDQGNHADAESLLTLALPHYRDVLDADHPDVLNALGNLAKARYHQADYAGADSLFRDVLAAYRAQFGHDHRLVALTLHDLGDIQREWGHLEEAESLYRGALTMRQRIFGRDHREVANSLVALAGVRIDREAFADGEALLLEGLDIQLNLSDPYPFRAATLEHLGDLLYRDARFAEAETYYRQAVDVYAIELGDPTRTAKAQLGLGRCLAALHADSEAEILLKMSRDTLIAYRGRDYELVREATDALASLQNTRRQ